MTESSQTTEPLVPPPGFTFDEDLLLDYDEQVASAIKAHEYQTAPIPSFENIPTVDIEPAFNPTGAPVEDIYGHARVPKAMQSWAGVHSEITGDPSSVEMWRVIDRSRLVDGTGLVSSRVLLDGSVGDVESFEPSKHFSSNHDDRLENAGESTPFVSFSTDPEGLAKAVLRHGFGIKEGRDSVVVRVKVDPSRIITGGKNKTPEVLLIGGVAPEEYEEAYEVSDFVANLVDQDAQIGIVSGEQMARDQVLQHWVGHEALTNVIEVAA